jgi:hypothetical protein
MITSKGKEILGKSLTNGTIPYASYIAVGAGARPRTTFSVDITSTESSTANATTGYAKIITSTNHDFQVGDYVKIYNTGGSNVASIYIGTWLITSVTSNSFKFSIGDTTVRTLVSPSPSPKVILDFSNKTSLDLEMFRIPITTKNSFIENGLSKIMFSADLPTTNRYEISEIGIFSDIRDNTAKVNSQTLFDFSTETWQYHSSTSISDILFKSIALDDGSFTNEIMVTDPVFEANANNVVFNNATRINRQERPRFYNNSYFVYGNNAAFTVSSNKLTPSGTTNHIEISNISLSQLKGASPSDEIKLALSIVNKAPATAAPDEIRVLLEFATIDSSGSSTSTYKYKRFHGILTSTQQDFTKNRYVVFTKKLSELESSDQFDWDEVKFVKIYSSVLSSGSPSANYLLAFDTISFNYATSNNPLYGLTGYTVIKNTNNLTITKEENAQQTIQFQFVVGI